MTQAQAVHVVLGRELTMPVEVRVATAMTAMFSCDADATQRMVDYAGLEVLRFRPGRGLVGLAGIHYIDGDLGPYHEFGVCVLVRQPGSRKAGVFVHRLPVDGEFTLAAGREIWGFPKELADFDADLTSRDKHLSLRLDGQLVADLRVRSGIRLPGKGAALPLTAYSHLDGVTRAIPWRMQPSGVRSRPGGASLLLGTHPIARELAGLRLSRRALFSTSIENLAMTFEDATPC